ncbi:MAG: aldo/keto reductase [Pelagibaca sp.]
MGRRVDQVAGAAAFADLAEEVGTDCATLAVAWVAHHPAVTSTLISARSAEQLQPSLDAMRIEMGAALHARISATGHAPATATDRSEQL